MYQLVGTISTRLFGVNDFKLSSQLLGGVENCRSEMGERRLVTIVPADQNTFPPEALRSFRMEFVENGQL